jgi:nucleotide-binding universal stress UspA family protein
MFRNIMIPLDGSAFAEAIIPLAAEIAGKSGATLHMVLVHRNLDAERAGDMSSIFLRDLENQALAQEKSYLADIAVKTRATNGVRVSEKLLEGPVIQTLQRHVAANRIDLVTMTTHGRGGFQRAWLGSVTDAMVRSLPVPVLALHAQGPMADWPLTRHLRHVIAATDGSDIADNAFRAALAVCATMNARCTLVHAIAPALPAYPAFVGETIAYTGADAGRMPTALLSMSRYDAMALEANVPLVTRVMVDARPADAILRCASEESADLIVLGTHGRNPMARWLLGSVADKVIRGAAVPVLVCPAETVFPEPEIVARDPEEVVEIC